MKHRNKTICILALAALILTVLCACGKNSDTFTVDYVGTANILSQNLFISGEKDGTAMKLSLKDAFQGCTVTKIEFVNGADVVMRGTEDGNILFEGGINVTLDDGSGNPFVLTIKEGSSFQTVTDGGSVYLLNQTK